MILELGQVLLKLTVIIMNLTDKTKIDNGNGQLPYYYEENEINTYFSENKIKIPETDKVRGII